MGVPKDTPLLAWEEVKYQDQLMINPVDQDRTLVSEQIENGDLLILQEELDEVSTRCSQSSFCWPAVGLSIGRVRFGTGCTFLAVLGVGFSPELLHTGRRSAVAISRGATIPQLRPESENGHFQAARGSKGELHRFSSAVVGVTPTWQNLEFPTCNKSICSDTRCVRAGRGLRARAERPDDLR